MKKMIFPAIIAIVGLVSGCKEISQYTNINVNIPYSHNVTVPQIPGTQWVLLCLKVLFHCCFRSIPIVTASRQYIAEYKTSAD